MKEKMDEMALAFRQAVGEYGRQLQQTSAEASEAVEYHNRNTHKHKLEAEAALDATTQRLQILEERSASLERHIAEQSQRNIEMAERISQRHEKVATTMESLRFTGDQANFSIEGLVRKLEDMQGAIATNEASLHDVYQKEREARVSEMRSLREAIGSEHHRLKSHLENRIATTVSEESGARSEHVAQVLDSVGAVLRNHTENSTAGDSSNNTNRTIPERAATLTTHSAMVPLTGSVQASAHGSVSMPAHSPVPIPSPLPSGTGGSARMVAASVPVFGGSSPLSTPATVVRSSSPTAARTSITVAQPVTLNGRTTSPIASATRRISVPMGVPTSVHRVGQAFPVMTTRPSG
eukprot:TRINITY_DN30067_c0_g1_i2.p1 TRINITY_DN30067_c0_g1~~TRINITY_DN30067_c0_g1_i2.p1  ORF type:complete len:351 (+),score=60.74 TRINITY_DN30067_c0_g1_i2:286-1338(+)